MHSLLLGRCRRSLDLFDKNLYNKSYFEAARSLGKRSILSVCEHFTNEADAERALLYRFFLWYGIITRTTPRMTTGYTFGRKPTTLEDSVLADGLDGVLRAGGGVAARWGCKWRDTLLIEAYEQDKRKRHNASKATCKGFPESFLWHFRWFYSRAPPWLSR